VYAGDTPLPMLDYSVTQVCEWCLQLDLDASPFWDYGITGAVLVGLSDGDFQASANRVQLRHGTR
jgi:hypothetical protein